METDFWHDRWRQGRIGFHLDDVHPALKRYWDELAVDSKTPVLVPLCGKSVDMRWLYQRGHPVTGIELSPIAIEQFFDECNAEPRKSAAGQLTCWAAKDTDRNIEVLEGDFFAWQAEQRFELFHDRAALVALPQALRRQYLAHLRAQLASNARGLLITLDYDQHQMDGPPFSVPAAELAESELFDFEQLECRDVLAGHTRFVERGVTRLEECVWRVRPRAG